MIDRRSKPEAEYTGRFNGEGAARPERGKKGWRRRDEVGWGTSKAEISDWVRGRSWDEDEAFEVDAEDNPESKSNGADKED